MSRLRALLLLLMLGLSASGALAVQPDEMLKDSALETRARALSGELRCMVCQNQSIDDSDAALARDIRLLVRERLKAGDSDQAVLRFLVDRYGDFILLKPPFSAATWLLWLTPALAILIGGAAILASSRRPARTPHLSEVERARLDALLAAEAKPEPSRH